jgi:hypothetical protein
MEQTLKSTATAYEVEEAMEGLHRVSWGHETIGYVLHVGRVYVALHGRVYNTAVEVGQTLDFESAVRHVVGD